LLAKIYEIGSTSVVSETGVSFADLNFVHILRDTATQVVPRYQVFTFLNLVSFESSALTLVESRPVKYVTRRLTNNESKIHIIKTFLTKSFISVFKSIFTSKIRINILIILYFFYNFAK